MPETVIEPAPRDPVVLVRDLLQGVVIYRGTCRCLENQTEGRTRTAPPGASLHSRLERRVHLAGARLGQGMRRLRLDHAGPGKHP